VFENRVHPIQSTKVTGRWIPRGKAHGNPTTGSKTRLDITGALHLETMDLGTKEHGTINGDSMIRFLENFQTLWA
jgi:hypothetical protein